MSKRIVIAGLTAVALLGSVGAVSAKTSIAAFLTAADSDKDGTVTLDEVKAYASERFKALETDKDGTLDKTELKGRLSATGFKSANTDADKTIDEAEFMGYVETLFKQANDNDTTLDAKELKSPAGKKLIILLH
jgi:Ca2+-binding EF-hand superfamily protein